MFANKKLKASPRNKCDGKRCVINFVWAPNNVLDRPSSLFCIIQPALTWNFFSLNLLLFYEFEMLADFLRDALKWIKTFLHLLWGIFFRKEFFFEFIMIKSSYFLCDNSKHLRNSLVNIFRFNDAMLRKLLLVGEWTFEECREN
jgi:hypothetical protein